MHSANSECDLWLCFVCPESIIVVCVCVALWCVLYLAGRDGPLVEIRLHNHKRPNQGSCIFHPPCLAFIIT